MSIIVVMAAFLNGYKIPRTEIHQSVFRGALLGFERFIYFANDGERNFGY